MKRVVGYGVDILIRNEQENNLNLEELIAEALEEKGLYILGVQFGDDLTEQYPDVVEDMEGIEIEVCVYRDTIEQHNESHNLSYVTVEKKLVEQYVKERKNGIYASLKEFLDEYTADDTEDFYEYAKQHNGVIKVEDY